MKVLVLDLEVSPTIATVWGLWGQNIGINQLLGNSEVLCWAASWADSDEVMFSSNYETTHRRMITAIHKLLDEADAVVTYNGDSFDLKVLNKEFALLGLSPPSPYKSIDLYKVVKKKFRFTSNKLDYVVQQFGLGKKEKHQGHELWLNVMNKKSSEYESSWATMKAYNIQDVVITEKLYHRIRGWIHNHPSYAVFNDDHCCPNCGGKSLQKRGFFLTAALRYQRYQCKDCGKWSRGKHAVESDKQNQLVGVN